MRLRLKNIEPENDTWTVKCKHLGRSWRTFVGGSCRMIAVCACLAVWLMRSNSSAAFWALESERVWSSASECTMTTRLIKVLEMLRAAVCVFMFQSPEDTLLSNEHSTRTVWKCAKVCVCVWTFFICSVEKCYTSGFKAARLAWVTLEKALSPACRADYE